MSKFKIKPSILLVISFNFAFLSCGERKSDFRASQGLEIEYLSQDFELEPKVGYVRDEGKLIEISHLEAAL